MSITNAQLQTTASNIYVSSGNTVVSCMYFCNTYSAGVDLNVFLIPAAAAGVTANASYQIYSNVLLASNDTFVTDWEKLVLSPGDQIRANATVASVVNATISYVGI